MSQYHVLHEGRRVGPYDRRTIVGMRLRNTLDPQQMLVDDLGRNITVAELMAEHRPAAPARTAPASGWPNFRVSFVAPAAAVLKVAAYTGEGEIRLQNDLLRIAGSTRGLFGTRRHGRVKLPLSALKSAALKGHRLELWFEWTDEDSQRLRQGAVAFETDSETALADLISQLPVPISDSGEVSAFQSVPVRNRDTSAGTGLNTQYGVWALIASVLVVILVVMALAIHRYNW